MSTHLLPLGLRLRLRLRLHLPLPYQNLRPLSTNSAISRGLRRSRSHSPSSSPSPSSSSSSSSSSSPSTFRINRSPVHPRHATPPDGTGIWTPPGAPPRPRDALPTSPPLGIHSRVWKPLGDSLESPDADAPTGANPSRRAVEQWDEHEGGASNSNPQRWDQQPRAPRPWNNRPPPPEMPRFSGGGRPSPRLDLPPAVSEGREFDWTPKPRRFVPKADYEAEWLYGTSVVEAALRAGRRKANQLYIYAGKGRTMEAREKDREMEGLAKKAGAKVVWEEDGGVLDSMSDSRPHNGYVLETHPLPKTPILSLGPVAPTKSSLTLTLAQHTSTNAPISTYPTTLYSRSPKGRYPFVLLLDEILDPGNLGAILRSAYFLGVTAVSLSTRNCAPLSPVALKASAGAAEYLPLLEHARAERVVHDSAEAGWTVFAAVPPVTKQQGRRDRYFLANEVGEKLVEGPVLLVVGSEGEGLRNSVKRECEYCVGLERAMGTDRVVDSLNVSVASALLCNAFLRG